MFYWIVMALWPDAIPFVMDQVHYVRKIQRIEAYIIESLPPAAAAERLEIVRSRYQLPMFRKAKPLPEPVKAAKEVPEPYQGFKEDQALLRKQVVRKAMDGGKDVKASSAEACRAAQRIFSRVSFLFRTREEVLKLLGDPATISDYNKPAWNDPESPLVYVFSTGERGLKYTISFGELDRIRVTQVQVESDD